MSLCVHIQIVPSRSLEKQNYRVIGRGLIKVARYYQVVFQLIEAIPTPIASPPTST